MLSRGVESVNVLSAFARSEVFRGFLGHVERGLFVIRVLLPERICQVGARGWRRSRESRSEIYLARADSVDHGLHLRALHVPIGSEVRIHHSHRRSRTEVFDDLARLIYQDRAAMRLRRRNALGSHLFEGMRDLKRQGGSLL